MSGLLVIAIGMVPVAALIAFVTRTIAKDRRRNALFAKTFEQESAETPETVSAIASQPGPTTSQAIAAPSTPRALPAAAPATSTATVPATSSTTPAPTVPPLGARIRIQDGRTGEVTAVERITRATRVHLSLDDGASGHVDIPDAAQPVQPAGPARPAPTRAIPAASPAATPTPTPVPATAAGVGPVPAAVVAPDLRAGAGTGGRVRLGGFSVPLTPAERTRP